MDYPIKVFNLGEENNNYIKLEILEVFGFPDKTSFKGGYEIKCNLEISSGIYYLKTNNYYSSTGALYDFYKQLEECYTNLNGKASYKVFYGEDDLLFDILFEQGKVKINGRYQDNPSINNVLEFEFYLDQSYFNNVLNDLSRIIKQFGNNSGIK